ncbi:MAG: hypothetical protein IJV85_00975 [Clostridia bacterium]|nr:hypothetical protein [Clostridia bacterium]
MKKLLALFILLTTLVFSSCAFPFTQQESSESASSSPKASSEALQDEIHNYTAVGGYVYEAVSNPKAFYNPYAVGLYFCVPDEIPVKNNVGLIAGDSVCIQYKGNTFDLYTREVYIPPTEGNNGTYRSNFSPIGLASATMFDEIVLDWSISFANVIKLQYFAPTETESARFVKINEDGSNEDVCISEETNKSQGGATLKRFCLSEWTDSPLYGKVVLEEDWEDGTVLYASYGTGDYDTTTNTYRIRGFYDKNPRP